MNRSQRRALVALVVLASTTSVLCAAQSTVDDSSDMPMPGSKCATNSHRSSELLDDATGFLRSIHAGFQIESGVNLDPGQGENSIVFGAANTDRANITVLNQAQLTLERRLNPDDESFAWGFAAQLLYGRDARFLHYPGLFDHLTNSPEQLVLRTATLNFHAPVPGTRGVDAKIGIFPSPVGYEPLDPGMTPFYSHSYIFNWGVPAFHSGFLLTAHMNRTLDLWFGRDTGASTGFGYGEGDNNRAGATMVGFGLNGLRGGKTSLLALAHVGSETPVRLRANAEHDTRVYSDLAITNHISDKWDGTLEGNYAQDTGMHAKAYGAAMYLARKISPSLTSNFRAELWRDAQGAFVAAFPGSLDPLLAVVGEPNTAYGVGPATYSEITAGVTVHKKLVRKAIWSLRPELRLDHSAGRRAFHDGRDATAFHAAVDLVLNF